MRESCKQQYWSPSNRPVLNRHFLNRHCNRSTNSDILWLARSWSRTLPETVLKLLAPPLLFVVNHFSLPGGSLLSMFFALLHSSDLVLKWAICTDMFVFLNIAYPPPAVPVAVISCCMIQSTLRKAQISEHFHPVEWLCLRIEITPWGVPPSHPCPMARRETIFCLWIMVFPCGTLHVDSLNCPSRAKHAPLHKKSIHTSLLFFLSVPEYVPWWSVSLHYEGKCWGVSYYTPLAGIGFYFPEEYLCSVKILIKNLQWVVAAVTTVMLPLQECASKWLYCRTQNFDCTTLHHEAEISRDDGLKV